MRHGNRHRIPALLGMLLIAVFGSPVFAGPSASQTFELRPGWNVIFLDVQPEARGPAEVFYDLPVESVWTWIDRHSSVEFIQDPAEGLWGAPGWHAWFSPSQAEPFREKLTNLFAILANRPYLIKLKGSENREWSVTGAPSVQPVHWSPNSFNLIGFHLDPSVSMSFQDFFSPSSAHSGQAMYRLNGEGRWQFIDEPSSTMIRSGEAYWVWCKGGSSYQGPLLVELPMARGIDFGSGLTELAVTIQNLSNINRTVALTPRTADLPLVYRDYDPSSTGFQWPSLNDMGALTLEPGARQVLSLGIRRESLSMSSAETVLEISDGLGVKLLVPIRAKQLGF